MKAPTPTEPVLALINLVNIGAHVKHRAPFNRSAQLILLCRLKIKQKITNRQISII